MDVSFPSKYKSNYKKGDKMIMTQQYIKLNTGVKEIKQLNSSGPDYRHNIRPLPYHI